MFSHISPEEKGGEWRGKEEGKGRKDKEKEKEREKEKKTSAEVEGEEENMALDICLGTDP